MPIKADFHLHSNFSGDSKTPMEQMIQKAIDLNLKTMCFTEHHDTDYPDANGNFVDTFTLNPDSYLYELLKLKEKYANQIQILFGLELGLQPHLKRTNQMFARAHDYDFIIGSSHISKGKDPFFQSFYEGRTEALAYQEYFESILENIKCFYDYDVYGHLDYVVRYGPTKNKNYSYSQYADLFDEILKLLIENEKGIELNTGGLKYGLGEPNPCFQIIKRYKELGGEIITVGSDAHAPEHIAYDFSIAESILKDCGYRYYTIFEKRMPEFITL